jgi:hypothetical protein
MRPALRMLGGEQEAHVRYRAEGGVACPVCRNTRIVSDEELQADRPNLVFYLRRRCIECGAGWIESFFLMGIDILHPPRSLHADKD